MVNTGLLRRTLAHIEQHPDEWNQGTWATRSGCRTAYCFAGWAVVLSGYEARFHDDVDISRDHDYADYVQTPDARLCELSGVPYDDNWVTINDAARGLLGLSESQADRLFTGVNGLAELRKIVAGLIADDAP
jgi:hypothetical protein